MPDDPLWYKDAVLYELNVRAFGDSTGAGVGDFKGLTARLDYLEDLGVTCLWLLPFYPSPQKDDGYDIADYYTVNPLYGTMEDFKEFLAEAHRRGLKVVTELVINHTSDQHPWFQRARRAPVGSPERDFYVWSDTPEKYANVGLMFPDFETSNWVWDPVAKAYYWHRFYSHQPDLNYDNPAVWEAIQPVVDFWFELGVDGMRLDAVPYLYEREGTTCEHLPETHAFLKALRKHVDERFPAKMLLAEANAWPEDAISYFGDGDECHMAFHFPLMPRLFMALQQEDRFPILDIYAQTPPIPATAQWCLFLRNHDELTLAMVTDEERDSLYRAYMQDRRAKIFLGIRHRLAPLLRNDRRQIELMNALLFSLPGTPVVYYGDEIGMGDNIYLGDRDGVRTPMQWSADRNAGFSRANPQKLYLPVIVDPEYHYEAVNVEAQRDNPSSLLWWTKRMIALRKGHSAFGRGELAFVETRNPKVIAYLRTDANERLLIVANLSRFMQYAALELAEFQGVKPEELFGRGELPAIGERPYPLTLGAHGYYWFALPEVQVNKPRKLPTVRLHGDWRDLSNGSLREELELFLPRVVNDGGPDDVTAVHVEGGTPLAFPGLEAMLLFLNVEYRTGIPDRLVFPLLHVQGEAGAALAGSRGDMVVAVTDPPGVLCDALALPEYAEGLLHRIRDGRNVAVPGGEFATTMFAEFEVPPLDPRHPPHVHRGERNNFSVTYVHSLILRIFRRIDDGPSPDLEVGRFLVGKFEKTPPILGHVDYRARGRAPTTLAVLRAYLPHHGTAWQHALDRLGETFERIAALPRETPPDVGEYFGGYLETVRRIGRLTGALHAALASDTTDPRFAPEPFDRPFQRQVYQTMRTVAAQAVEDMRLKGEQLPEPVAAMAKRLVPLEAKLVAAFAPIQDADLRSKRFRCHGDYQLARLLYTGVDFAVADFGGDARMSGGQARIKRSPLRDAASLAMSWRYAAYSAIYGLPHPHGRAHGLIRPEDQEALAPWAEQLLDAVNREFLAAYAAVPGVADLLPATPEATRKLFDLLLLERALVELERDLRKLPEWVPITLGYVLGRIVV